MSEQDNASGATRPIEDLVREMLAELSPQDPTERYVEVLVAFVRARIRTGLIMAFSEAMSALTHEQLWLVQNGQPDKASRMAMLEAHAYGERLLRAIDAWPADSENPEVRPHE